MEVCFKNRIMILVLLFLLSKDGMIVGIGDSDNDGNCDESGQVP